MKSPKMKSPNSKKPHRSRNVPFQFCFYGVPCDIILEVFSYSSPFDLLQIQQTCKLFNYILIEHDMCWKRSFLNMGLPPPPSLIPMPGNWSLATYAQIIFGGGKCSLCGNGTENFPVSFILRIRVCSKQCLTGLQRAKTVLARIPNSSYCDQLLRGIGFDKRSLPYHSYNKIPDATLYRRSDIIMAVEEYQHALAMDIHFTIEDDTIPPINGPSSIPHLKEQWGKRKINVEIMVKAQQNILDWHDEYTRKKQAVSRVNRAFLMAKALEEHIQATRVTSAPTTVRVTTAYNRDLEYLTNFVWKRIRHDVLDEIKAARASRLEEIRNEEMRRTNQSQLHVETKAL